MTPNRERGPAAVARAVHRAAVVAAMVTVVILAPATAWAHVTVDSTGPNGDGTTTVARSHPVASSSLTRAATLGNIAGSVPDRHHAAWRRNRSCRDSRIAEPMARV
jgi:hypothetical protein